MAQRNSFPTIHGYPVVAMAIIPDTEGTRKNLRVVLVDRGDEYRHDRYVVSLWCVGDAEWMSGYYTSDIGDAMDTFRDKVHRNYPRPVAVTQEPGVPIICCQSFALTMLTNRPPMHTVGCPNRRP